MYFKAEQYNKPMKSYFNFLRRNKAYSAINLLGLSISLTLLMLIGSYVWHETSMDRWQSNADNIYALCYADSTGSGELLLGSAWAMQHRLRDQFPEIINSCAVTDPNTQMIPNPNSTGPSDQDLRTDFLLVDSTFFSVFDFELEAGDRRTVLSDPRSAVITAEFGRKLFGDEDPMGQTISLGRDSATVVVTGIMKQWKNTVLCPPGGKGLGGQSPVDMLARFEMVRFFNGYKLSPEFGNASDAQVFIVGREGDDLTKQAPKYHDFMKDIHWLLNPARSSLRLSLVPFLDMHFSPASYAPCIIQGDTSFVKILVIAGIVILIFALINYVNLTVAQASWRAKEMATRRLIGSSKAGVMCRLVAESMVMVLISMAVAAVLAVALAPIASRMIGTDINVAQLLDPTTLLLGLGIALLLGLSAGIIPAIFLSAAKPIDIVRGTFRTRAKSSYSRIFIIVQNAVTIIMIVAAFTIYKQTRALIEAPMGFNYKDVVIIYGPGNLAHPAKAKLQELSCVESVSLSRGTPIDGGNNNTVAFGDKLIPNQIIECDSSFLDVYGIEIESNDGSDGVFVNHQLLSEYGMDENATSFQNQYQGGEAHIAGTFRDFRIRNILEDTHPMYIKILPNHQLEYCWSISIKIVGDQQYAWDQIVNAYAELTGGADLRQLVTRPFAEDIIKANFEKEERLSQILAVFAIVAVLISVLGLVAMSTYYVQQRQREIAVRKVFGSTSNEVLGRLLRSFSANVLVSLVIAIPVAWLMMNDWLSQYSYHISLSWWIFAGAGALCLAISVLAVLVQSHRAANANPVRALYRNL